MQYRVAVKRLTAVEAQPQTSHQHELHGVSSVRSLFDIGHSPVRLGARFVYLSDAEPQTLVPGYVTWYDARAAHPTRSEWRLYFPSNEVFLRAEAGDLLLMTRTPHGMILAVTAQGSLVEALILHVLGRKPLPPKFHDSGSALSPILSLVSQLGG